MRYKCQNCGVEEWRGYFPERFFHIRYALFHGVALGVAAIVVRMVFQRMGLEADGFVMLPACLVVLVAIYGLAVLAEHCIVAVRGCARCKSRRLYIVK